ncbi:hypothetical protein [Nocardia sp. NPDC050175]|uniref:hypothetical protein n=1 Tax=Nocardia sp. NPDC050175 TaxID=3364317 RepID=UPI00378F3B5B
MRIRKLASVVSLAVVLTAGLSAAGIGAAAAATPERVDAATAAKDAVVQVIEAREVALQTDAARLDTAQLSSVDTEMGLQLVSVPIAYSEGNGGVVKFIVEGSRVLSYVEKQVRNLDGGSRLVSTWQDGSLLSSGPVRTIGGDPFTDCLEGQAARGAIAKWALQKCYSGTLISPAQGAACLLGLGVTRQQIEQCQQLSMA